MPITDLAMLIRKVLNGVCVRTILFALAACFAQVPRTGYCGAFTQLGGGSDVRAIFQGSHVYPLVLEDAPTQEFQYSLIQPLGQTGSGFQEQVGGMSAGILPDLAFISITNGSYIRLTPPADPPPNGGWYATLDPQVNGMRFQWNPLLGAPNSPADVYFSMQYTLTGYLAPGATLHFNMSSGLLMDSDHNLVAGLHDSQQLAAPGAFSFTYSKTLQVLDFNSFRFHDLMLNLDASLRIEGGASGQTSWAILDPGVGTGTNPANLQPWVPQEVPEPASLLLGLTGVAGLPLLRRRRLA